MDAKGWYRWERWRICAAHVAFSGLVQVDGLLCRSLPLVLCMEWSGHREEHRWVLDREIGISFQGDGGSR